MSAIATTDTGEHNAAGRSGGWPAEKDVWLGAGRGVYLVENNNKVTLVADIGKVSFMKGVGDAVWVAASSGVYRIDARSRAVDQTPNPPSNIAGVARVGSRVWLLANGAIYLAGAPQPVADFPKSVSCIAGFDDGPNKGLWIGADDGVHRVLDDGKPTLVSKEIKCRTTALIDQVQYFGADKGLYFLDAGSLSKVENSPSEVSGIGGSKGLMWCVAKGKYYRLQQPDRQGASKPPTTFQELDPTLGGIDPRLNGNILALQFTPRTSVGFSAPTDPSRGEKDSKVPSRFTYGDDMWVTVENGVESGLYLIRGEPNSAAPFIKRVPHADLDVRFLEFINGRLWLGTNKGAYRVDLDVTIALDVESKEKSLWKEIFEAKWLAPNLVQVSGTVKPVPYYQGADGTEPYGSRYGSFTAVILTDAKRFRAALLQADKGKDQRNYVYIDPERSVAELRVGDRVVYYSVQDEWQNTFTGRIPVLVSPGPVAFSLLLGFFWAFSLFLIIFLAPYSILCHAILMKRGFRKYGSLNIAPLVVTVIRPIRLHVLRRYLSHIRNENDFAEWGTRFIVPSDDSGPERLTTLLSRNHGVILLGQSGIGKSSYLKYLVWRYLSNISHKWLRGALVPLFVPLESYRAMPPDQMIHTSLASYGEITDEEITTGMLHRGGFVIFLDGLNQLDAAARVTVSSFVNQHRARNYFFLSSQEDYPVFNGERVTLTPLSPAKVDEYIRRRIKGYEADRVISQLSAQAYEIYGLPEDLELALDLLKTRSDYTLPLSRRGLYEAITHPIFENWRRDGHHEYRGLLLARTYEMLRTRDGSFDQANGLPQDLRGDLLRNRLLVLRYDCYSFRHEQIAAFLAAKHFAPQWQSLLDQEERIDFDWIPMLKFTIPDLKEKGRAELKALFFKLIKKNKFVAGELFEWLRSTDPESCEQWSEAFKRRLDGATLDKG